MIGADLLAAEMKKRDLSCRAAGDLLGISPSLVNLLKNRLRSPGREVSLALRDKLGIPVDAKWLLVGRRVVARRPRRASKHGSKAA